MSATPDGARETRIKLTPENHRRLWALKVLGNRSMASIVEEALGDWMETRFPGGETSGQD